MSNYAKIKKFDIANGTGIRTSLFMSGCLHHCKGCFNKELWDYEYGQPCGAAMIDEITNSMNEHISGLSILGGEPFDPKNVNDLYTIVKTFKQRHPIKTIWIWTGYTLEELQSEHNPHQEINIAILGLIDVLVDGKYIEEERDLNLKWCGSTNQRVIRVVRESEYSIQGTDNKKIGVFYIK